MNKKDDFFFMQQALLQAKEAFEKEEIPIGAIITFNNKIIARSHNQVQTLCDPTAHAEMLAITSATSYLGSKYLQKCTLYITVEPCVMCAGALGWAQIGKIVYGASDKKKGYTQIAPEIFLSKTQIENGILQNQCSQLLHDFFKNIRE